MSLVHDLVVLPFFSNFYYIKTLDQKWESSKRVHAFQHLPEISISDPLIVLGFNTKGKLTLRIDDIPYYRSGRAENGKYYWLCRKFGDLG